MNAPAPALGATPLPGGKGVRFRVWAPRCSGARVVLLRGKKETAFPLQQGERGYFTNDVTAARAGDLYFYELDGDKRRPDPASLHQPQGVHGPSQIIDLDRFLWRDASWRGVARDDLVLYELHIGTFTPEGTFEAVIGRIPYLKALGITCVEIMPVAQFPGARNWGYDGVGLFAAQHSYGGPKGLRRLVDACHRAGLAVALDVVYNHFGPEGNYLADFGPYFTARYKTLWGAAVNYDDAGSDEVRAFVIANACHWVANFHIDVLRLDAVHSIYDTGAYHILAELNDAVQRLARKLRRIVHVIAESDLNDARVVRPRQRGGHGLAAQWSDDFHHSVHSVLTGERQGYYEDFGRIGDIADAMKKGFVYDGRYSVLRKRRHGGPATDLSPRQLVVCTQNHDQVGNRALGERLSALATFEQEKIAAFLLLLNPNVPLLFMGQEYGETAPFQYFVDFGDAELREAVRKGRREEFAAFGWTRVPDPSAPDAFEASRLNRNLLHRHAHAQLLTLYRDLLQFRKRKFAGTRVLEAAADEEARTLLVRYPRRQLLLVSFSDQPQAFAVRSFAPLLSSDAARYGGQAQALRPAGGRVTLPPHTAVFGQGGTSTARLPRSTSTGTRRSRA